MKLAAWKADGILAVAKFGDWKWLNDGMPAHAKPILNEKCGRAVTIDEIERFCMKDKYSVNTADFSNDQVMQYFLNSTK